MVETEGLSRQFKLGRGLLQAPKLIRAVSDIDLAIPTGSCLGVVGESGSGKSTLGRLVLGLLPPSAGRVRVLGQDVNTLARSEWRRLRRDLALVQQNPRAALDPRWTIGAQVIEPLAIHEPGLSAAARMEAQAAALEAVGLPLSLAQAYPHQLSGGQRQRVVLARALILRPKLIVMDEPTSALDVSVQAQVMEVISALKARFSLTYLFISHDLRNIRRIADRIAVMYAGRIVEEGSADAICRAPIHPYSRSLLAAIPSLARHAGATTVGGEPPDPASLPGGCAFHPRCPLAIDACRTLVPDLATLPDGRRIACHLAEATGETASAAAFSGAAAMAEAT